MKFGFRTGQQDLQIKIFVYRTHWPFRLKLWRAKICHFDIDSKKVIRVIQPLCNHKLESKYSRYCSSVRILKSIGWRYAPAPRFGGDCMIHSISADRWKISSKKPAKHDSTVVLWVPCSMMLTRWLLLANLIALIILELLSNNILILLQRFFCRSYL